MLCAGAAFVMHIYSCGPPQRCGNKQFSDEDIRVKVEGYLEQRGEHLPKDRKAAISVRRDGCDYLYTEKGIPPVPGDHFVVRLSRDGKVLDVLYGR
jgi:hypothetical protein